MRRLQKWSKYKEWKRHAVWVHVNILHAYLWMKSSSFLAWSSSCSTCFLRPSSSSSGPVGVPCRSHLSLMALDLKTHIIICSDWYQIRLFVHNHSGGRWPIRETPPFSNGYLMHRLFWKHYANQPTDNRCYSEPVLLVRVHWQGFGGQFLLELWSPIRLLISCQQASCWWSALRTQECSWPFHNLLKVCSSNQSTTSEISGLPACCVIRPWFDPWSNLKSLQKWIHAAKSSTKHVWFGLWCHFSR